MNTKIEFETTHDDAELVARAIAPDNTDEIETRAENGRVITTIERPSLGSLQTTADDYIRNLSVAAEIDELEFEDL
ncbi:MAG: KEOPS complex subunit Pcc1 [Halobacteria archaeon]|nr:KEOPS complex subunit Pcc1 [Halobacteria archaeon]